MTHCYVLVVTTPQGRTAVHTQENRPKTAKQVALSYMKKCQNKDLNLESFDPQGVKFLPLYQAASRE